MSELSGESCGSGCSAKAPFALQVLGDSMEPEFRDGAIIIVDPNLPLAHGAYVVADADGETTFRQVQIRDSGKYLVALKDGYPDQEINSSFNLRGVVTQQSRNRKLGIKRARHYA